MKKSWVIAIVIIIILALATGGYFIFSNKDISSKNTADTDTCTDSDGGMTLDEKGTIQGPNSNGDLVTEEDFCADYYGRKIENCEGGRNCMIQEFQCTEVYGNKIIVDSNGYFCEGGCANGACL